MEESEKASTGPFIHCGVSSSCQRSPERSKQKGILASSSSNIRFMSHLTERPISSILLFSGSASFLMLILVFYRVLFWKTTRKVTIGFLGQFNRNFICPKRLFYTCFDPEPTWSIRKRLQQAKSSDLTLNCIFIMHSVKQFRVLNYGCGRYSPVNAQKFSCKLRFWTLCIFFFLYFGWDSSLITDRNAAALNYIFH